MDWLRCMYNFCAMYITQSLLNNKSSNISMCFVAKISLIIISEDANSCETSAGQKPGLAYGQVNAILHIIKKCLNPIRIGAKFIVSDNRIVKFE